MNSSTENIGNGERERVPGRILVGLFFFVLLAHAFWFALSGFPDEFIDGDGYVRVLRVEMLWQNGSWFDNTLPRNNAPYGDTSHWTRPLDVLISLLALPLVPFLGAKPAIFWGGAMSGPVLHAGTVAALAWAAAPLVGRTASVLAGIFVAGQALVWSYASAMRADHHILFLFLAAAGFGLMVRALGHSRSVIRFAAAAGAMAAAGVWVGIEGLAYAGLCVVSFGLFWLAEGDTSKAPLGLAFGTGFATGLIAALLLERGFDALTVEYERLSVVHATLGIFVLAGFALLHGLGRLRPWRGWFERALAGGACGALVLGAWYGLFPGFARGPMVDYDPETVALIFAATAEYVPGDTLDRFPVTLGVTALAFPWLFWRLWRERARREGADNLKYASGRGTGSLDLAASAAGSGRWAWIHLALCVAFYGAITAAWGRWGIYAGLFPCVALGDMVLRITNRIMAGKGSRLARESGCALVVAGFLIGPLAAAYAAIKVFTPKERTAQLQSMKTCSGRPLAAALAAPPWSDRSRVVMTSANIAGELMYRTPHGIVASSYRKGYEGWRDTLRFLSSTDEKRARGLLDRRKVDLIAICPAFGFEMAGDKLGPGTMYDRMITGRAPAWMREIALPASASAFRLFEVLPEGRWR
ncbi:MAG: hypothetical protein IT564_01475 [Rhodospirillales bacterium]|nr:hypothetical protein [Rhodospirillales bacterium]